MGGQKQKQKHKQKKNLDRVTQEVSVTSNRFALARNLRKADLGAVIFGTKHSTINECLNNQLFGLPEPHFSYIKNISQGLVLFLFNYSDRKLYGIFEAASQGQMYIDEYAWVGDADHSTLFPAQVRIRVREECQALSENQFKPIIATNYYDTKHFYFELDHDQTKKLISLFKSMPVNSSASSTNWNNNMHTSIPKSLQDGFDNVEQFTEKASSWNVGPKISYASVLGQSSTSTTIAASTSQPPLKWSSLFKNESTDDGKSGTHNDVYEEDKAEWEESQPFNDEVTHVKTWEDEWSTQENTWDVDETTTDKADFLQGGTLGEEHGQTLVLSGQHVDSSPQPVDDNPDCQLSSSAETSEGDQEEEEEEEEEEDYEEQNTVAVEVQETSTDLQSLVEKLIQEVQGLKGSQMKQIVKINMLQNELVESKQEIQQLKTRVGSLECGPLALSTSISVKSVFIVGGFDGSSWLQSLDSYFPSHDIKYPLTPMNFQKKYASAAPLNGEIYHFGGEESNTVESFSPKTNEWISRPALFSKKIRVTGAAIEDKLFALGGSNGSQCSSEVEYLDLNLGKWLPTHPMQTKRLFPAAAELDNALYVTGGFDGACYTSSVERFDPREKAWYKLPNMNTNKGCHSMVVLNEKLYTLGGFDGENYVGTVECFDTRMGSWVEAEPMDFSRGYFGAFVLGEKIYAIGGVTGGNELLEKNTVECYKEGSGWESVDLKAIGKRSHFSAIVLT